MPVQWLEWISTSRPGSSWLTATHSWTQERNAPAGALPQSPIRIFYDPLTCSNRPARPDSRSSTTSCTPAPRSAGRYWRTQVTPSTAGKCWSQSALSVVPRPPTDAGHARSRPRARRYQCVHPCLSRSPLLGTPIARPRDLSADFHRWVPTPILMIEDCY